MAVKFRKQHMDDETVKKKAKLLQVATTDLTKNIKVKKKSGLLFCCLIKSL